MNNICLLYTSDAADERSSVDLGGRRIIKKKKQVKKNIFKTYRQEKTSFNHAHDKKIVSTKVYISKREIRKE